jgi:hypothetical protein
MCAVGCRHKFIWKGAVIQKVLESRSRGIAIVRSFYQTTARVRHCGLKKA